MISRIVDASWRIFSFFPQLMMSSSKRYEDSIESQSCHSHYRNGFPPNSRNFLRLHRRRRWFPAGSRAHPSYQTVSNILLDPRLRWVPGKPNYDADVLSRAPVDKATTSDTLGERLPSYQGKSALLSLNGNQLSQVDPNLDPVFEKIKFAAAIDPVMVKLKNQLISGF